MSMRLKRITIKEITAPYGMVLNEEVHSVELVYAGQNVDVTETGTSFYNERQRVEIDLIKSLAIDEAYGIGKNGEIFDVTFGLYAAEELTAADGKTIPADGLLEVISLDESGHGKAISDLPMGSYYVQEISTNSAYIVSDAKYPVTFEYAGQDTETVRITANEGEAITNDIIYGSVSGKKSDEDGKTLGGAVIGIFKTGTTEFTKENAIAATTSKDDGSFSFAKVPYGTWIIREIESPKEFGFYPEFTVEDYLLYIAALKGIRPVVAKKRVKELIAKVGLSKVANKKMKKLSGGMKRRAGIAQAMLNNPKILILDEPTAGLDPNERIRFRNLISELSEDRLVLLSTHIVSDIEYIANEILLMKDGKLMHKGTADEIINSMTETVWECFVEKNMVSDFMKKYKISNMKSEADGVILRIISHEKPFVNAQSVEASLEDVFLYYFGEKAGDENAAI